MILYFYFIVKRNRTLKFTAKIFKLLSVHSQTYTDDHRQVKFFVCETSCVSLWLKISGGF